MHDTIAIPDIAETIVGHRAWGIARTPTGLLLVSHGHTIWPPGTPLTATCGKKHTPPGDNCTCGIYALTTQEGFPYYTYDGPNYAIWGEVHLWGEIIRGSKGYRAQHAYPKTLRLAHKDWQLANQIQNAYRVPVTLANPFHQEPTHGHR
jgi:hypothetical protein